MSYYFFQLLEKSYKYPPPFVFSICYDGNWSPELYSCIPSRSFISRSTSLTIPPLSYRQIYNHSFRTTFSLTERTEFGTVSRTIFLQIITSFRYFKSLFIIVFLLILPNCLSKPFELYAFECYCSSGTISKLHMNVPIMTSSRLH